MLTIDTTAGGLPLSVLYDHTPPGKDIEIVKMEIRGIKSNAEIKDRELFDLILSDHPELKDECRADLMVRPFCMGGLS